MRAKNLFLLMVVLLPFVCAKAETTDVSAISNALYVNDACVSRGKTVTLSLQMKNSKEVVGFQCDFYAPAHSQVALDDSGLYAISLSEDRTTANNTNTFDFALQSDGAIRILACSSRNIPFEGNEGEVAKIVLSVDEDIEPGQYPLILRNIVLSDDLGNTITVPYVETTLTVEKYSVGDVNRDGRIDVSDISYLVNIILGRTSE